MDIFYATYVYFSLNIIIIFVFPIGLIRSSAFIVLDFLKNFCCFRWFDRNVIPLCYFLGLYEYFFMSIMHTCTKSTTIVWVNIVIPSGLVLCVVISIMYSGSIKYLQWTITCFRYGNNIAVATKCYKTHSRLTVNSCYRFSHTSVRFFFYYYYLYIFHGVYILWKLFWQT